MAISLTFCRRAKVKGNKDPNCSMHTESRSENESPLCVHSFASLLTGQNLMGIFIYSQDEKRKHRACPVSSCTCCFRVVESRGIIWVYKEPISAVIY